MSSFTVFSRVSRLLSLDEILLVDWKAIVREARTATNYQVLPGDRVYVGSSPTK